MLRLWKDGTTDEYSVKAIEDEFNCPTLVIVDKAGEFVPGGFLVGMAAAGYVGRYYGVNPQIAKACNLTLDETTGQLLDADADDELTDELEAKYQTMISEKEL